ncbi:MAG: ABC transporter ATP-binding protein [Betaproteobacteria bacterium]|nr:ABC transporter ATP-binding protein [Betaproteobacteria bacterium]
MPRASCKPRVTTRGIAPAPRFAGGACHRRAVKGVPRRIRICAIGAGGFDVALGYFIAAHPRRRNARQGEQGVGEVKLRAADVSLEYVNQRTGNRRLALDRVSLEVSSGEFVCIVGPSGCGKTTFLNCADGLLPITSGTLTLDGKQIVGPGRGRSMVFQHASLLPWRTVLGNIIYGLEIQGSRRSKAIEHAREFVELVGLAGFEDAYPYELSGGMQQRVNLARALATDPEVLLLDEPFAALDAQTREFMQLELLKIWRRTQKTALFITHQVSEAIYLADRVIVFSARPGSVKETVAIDLPRPRPLRLKRDSRFLRYEDAIWDLIEVEARKTSETAADEAPLLAAAE